MPYNIHIVLWMMGCHVMSKKKEKRKEASFTLEADGFSVHTFALSRKIMRDEYHEIKEALYWKQGKNGGEIYKDKKNGNYVCNSYTKSGLRIQLEHNKGNGIDTYFVRMIVNPRKLIDPGSSYLGILSPEKSSVQYVADAFAELLESSPFDNDINAYKLCRIDLCANIRCDNRKLFREMVRVLRKLPTPPKYEGRFYKHEDKKEANRYNKHYLRFHCGTHELVIYDKTYQMRENGLVVAYEKLPEGVLRFEVHCERDYLRKVEKESGKQKTVELLWWFIRKSEERMIAHFSRCFPDSAFAQKDELEQMIAASHYREKTKEAMLELVERLQRVQSVDKALETMKKQGYDTDTLLDKFGKLGISPIPLWKNFCARRLPGPVELLKSVSGGAVTVEYIKVKYK